jgi:hypothetical protein
MSEKPFIFPDAQSDLERFNEINIDAVSGGFDSSYIPGYSEIVKANEIAASNDLEFAQAHKDAVSGARTKDDWYKIIGARPQKLPVYFKWLRVTSVSGDRSYNADVEVAQHQRRGWRLATDDDLGSHGWGLPPAGILGADRYIRRLDTALFVIDAALEDRYQAALRKTPDDEAPKVGENTQVEIDVQNIDSGQFTLATKE